MGVTELSGQVEPELHVVLNDRVTDLNLVGGSLLHDLLLQKGLNGRVKLFADVLNHNGVSVSHRCFEVLEVVAISKLQDVNLFILAEVTDPLVSLSLGINEQGPSSGGLSDDSVINREVIRRKGPQVPLADFYGVTEDLLEAELSRVRDLSLSR